MKKEKYIPIDLTRYGVIAGEKENVKMMADNVAQLLNALLSGRNCYLFIPRTKVLVKALEKTKTGNKEVKVLRTIGGLLRYYKKYTGEEYVFNREAPKRKHKRKRIEDLIISI